ncbi:MAG: ABC transporter substrate-binding protein [Myxococcota bacterium]
MSAFRSSLAALTPLSLVALVACSGGGTAKDAAGGPDSAKKWETRDTLVIATPSDIGSLIPVKPRTAADSFIVANLSVDTIDSDFDCTLKKKPGLAKKWEWSDDGKTVKLELDDRYTWEDGEKVTADDIAFAYELAGDKDVASPRFGFLEYMTEDARPKVVDDTHLEFHFTRAYDRDTQTAHVSLTAMPRHILGDADRKTLEGHPFATQPTFFGPWRLAKHTPNQSVVLEPNWNFTGPETMRPKLSRVMFKVIPEYSARLIALEKGDVDFMEGVQIADVDRLRKEHPDDIRVVLRGYRAMDYIGWNGSKYEPFNDLKVRRALAHGVDQQRIIGKILTGEDGTVYGKQAISTITPELCGVHNENVKPLEYDPEKAKALLAEAGWSDTNGDGIIDKDGKNMSFTLVTNQGNKRRADAAVEIQSDLKKLGVDMQIDFKEANTFFDKVEAREYEAFLAGWSAGLYVDPGDVWGTETPDSPKPFNHVLYSNPEVDSLIDRGLQTPDPREAAPIWQEVQAKIYDDQPYMFLWWQNVTVAVSTRFENTTIDLLSPHRNLHEWEVPADKVKYKR